jgi:hypothetical protein
MDLTADAMDLYRPRVGGWVGVDLEAPELAGGLAAERNHPAIVNWLGAFSRATGLGHPLILSVASRAVHEALRLNRGPGGLENSTLQTMRPSTFAFDRLFRMHHDLAAALRVIRAVAQHSATLHEMTRTLTRVSGDTEALPPLSTDMASVADATSMLGGIDAAGLETSRRRCRSS